MAYEFLAQQDLASTLIKEMIDFAKLGTSPDDLKSLTPRATETESLLKEMVAYLEILQKEMQAELEDFLKTGENLTSKWVPALGIAR